MNNLKTAVLIVIIFIIGVSGVFWIYQTQVKQAEEDLLPLPTVEPIPAEEAAPPSPDITDILTQAPPVQPEAGSDTVEIKNAGIFLETPEASSKITSPVIVSGKANILGDIVLKVKDANGNVLGEEKTAACVSYDACPFSVTLHFKPSTNEAGTIEVLNQPAADASLKHVQSILIRF